MTRSILIAAIVLLVALIDGRPTEAAQVVVVRPDLFDQTAEKAPPLGCNVKLIGEVESGDLARLQTANETAVPGQKYNPSFLCLDSPGGNYSEAVAISRWLMGGGEHKGPWISTVVDDGATCASACALVFLAGSTFEHVAHIPNRWLHANGRLGFHAPFLEEKALPTTNFTRQAIVSAFTAAQRSFLSLVNEFSARRRDHDAGPFPRPWVRLSLLLDFMTRGPNEILWIDTVDEIGRWEIQLFGATTPKRQLSIADAANACRNAIAWYRDRSSIELYSDTNPDNFYDRIELQKSNLARIMHEVGSRVMPCRAHARAFRPVGSA